MTVPMRGTIALTAGMLGICSGFLSGAWAAIPPSRPPLPDLIRPETHETIRVRIAEMKPGESSMVRGLDLRWAPGSRQLALDRTHARRTRIRCTKNGVSVGNTMPLVKIETSSPGGFIYWNGSPVRGRLSWIRSGKGCDVINELDIEKYLDGIVNSEFSSKWHPEAVAAQVIAARSYAVAQRTRARKLNRHYDVESTVSDQVYDGVKSEDYLASRLVSKTRGWVLALPENQTAKGRAPSGASTPPVLKAYYHSRCGGETELPRRVWGSSDKGFRQVTCPFCRRSPGFEWEEKVALPEIHAALSRGIEKEGPPQRKKLWKSIRADVLRSVSLHTDRGGRVKELRVKTPASAKTIAITGNEFRKWMGYSRIRSTLFAIRAGDREIIFKGKGSGHGVGMCQWGAKIMAEKGAKTADILKLYYPNALLKKLW